MPEGRVVALDPISSLCSAVCKRLKYQSLSQSTAPGRASCSTGNTKKGREDKTEEDKDDGKEGKKGRARAF